MNNIKVGVKLTGLAFGGAAIGDIVEGPPDLIGKKAFVSGGIPGETVTAQITSEERSFVNAEVIEILSPSPHRITPICPVFSKCGGCSLQHMTIEAQRDAKLKMVESQLSRQAKITPLHPVELLGADLPAFHYRSRVQLHSNAQNELGFYRPKSGEVVDIDECAISKHAVNDALRKSKRLIVENDLGKYISSLVIEEAEGRTAVLIKLNEDAPSSASKDFECFDSSFPSVSVRRLGSLDLLYRSTSEKYEDGIDTTGHFSQVNEAGNAVLLEAASRLLSSKSLTEFYAGAGNFTIPLALSGKSVHAVEVDAALAEKGRAIAESNGLKGKVQFTTSSAEAFVKKNKPSGAILLDPPRAGALHVVKHFHPKLTNEIVYISCNLPSFARDLKLLVEAGFVLERVYAVDMFPQTYHIEMAARLIGQGSPN